MRKILMSLILMFLVSTMLSGCIIWPWWEDGGHGGHGGHGGGYHDHDHGRGGYR